MSPAATIGAAEAETALLAAADDLFYRRGIVDVSMAEIRDLSGLSMRRVYAIADSKSELVTLWLRYRHHEWMAGYAARVDAAMQADAPAVDAAFTALADWMIDTDFRGCAFINTHAEAGALTDHHREIVREHKRSLAEYLDHLVGHGDELAVLIDGAIVQSSIFGDTQPVQAARRAAHTLTGATIR